MPLFDRYVVVDWSAMAKPCSGENSIWIGSVHSAAADVCENPRTRRAAEQQVRNLLYGAVEAGERVLVGFDFPYGYPSGLADALALDASDMWRGIWRELSATVKDDDTNRNNRFDIAGRLNERTGTDPGPFWGCPERVEGPHLGMKKKGLVRFADEGGALEEYRLTERWLRSRRRRVQSAWKLMGVGSVGSQALLGIPVVARLRDDDHLSMRSAVWPFEMGFSFDPTDRGRIQIVHAEIWPSMLDADTILAVGNPVKDACQVLALARWLCECDAAEELGRYFNPPDLDMASRDLACAEEGWILGAM